MFHRAMSVDAIFHHVEVVVGCLQQAAQFWLQCFHAFVFNPDSKLSFSFGARQSLNRRPCPGRSYIVYDVVTYNKTEMKTVEHFKPVEDFVSIALEQIFSEVPLW